jgi:hypothetical protein
MNKRLIDGDKLFKALEGDAELVNYIKSGRFDIPSDQGEAARLRGALTEVKRLVTESKGRMWTGVGICDVVDRALSYHTEDKGLERRECPVCKGTCVDPFDWTECRPCNGIGSVAEDTGIQKARGWITISEELPDHNKTVLLHFSSGKIESGYVKNFGDGKLSAVKGGISCSFEDITHWMFLPDAPPSISITIPGINTEG